MLKSETIRWMGEMYIEKRIGRRLEPCIMPERQMDDGSDEREPMHTVCVWFV